MRWRWFVLLGALPCPAAKEAKSRKAASSDETVDSTLAAGHTALRKGLHHKAFDHYKTVHRGLSTEAYEHSELQEGLCVCAAKLRKEKVAVSACENASALRSSSSPPPPLPLLMAQGEAKLFAGEPMAARATFRAAAAEAARKEALRLEKDAREAVRRAEGRLFVSFRRQRGFIAEGSLRTSAFALLADALEACTAEPACKSLGINLLSASKAGSKVRAPRPQTPAASSASSALACDACACGTSLTRTRDPLCAFGRCAPRCTTRPRCSRTRTSSRRRAPSCSCATRPSTATPSSSRARSTAPSTLERRRRAQSRGRR